MHFITFHCSNILGPIKILYFIQHTNTLQWYQSINLSFIYIIYSDSNRNTTFATGLRKLFVAVLTSTLRTIPCESVSTSQILPIDQSALHTFSSFINTASPIFAFRCTLVHFFQLCSVPRYSPFHLFQNTLAKC